nr:hypothetical protein [Tanacetum cinerariifolium]
MDPYNHSTLISTKLPILDTRKFEQWKFRIQQYLQHEHYALWEVIEFGDSYKAPSEETAKDKGLAGEVSSSTKKKGRTVAITAEDMQKRKNDVKARTTLLLALPDEHQLRFNKYDSAKELWKAILKTFGENEATKKTKKNQMKQKYGNFKAEGSKTLEQTFNRDDLDTMSLDDVYNHLKVYEPELLSQIDLKLNMRTSLRLMMMTEGRYSLATNRTYNFSKRIFDGMRRNVKNETAFPIGDVRYRKAFPTDTSFDAGQDKENIAKTSSMPHEALPRVTSLGGGKGKKRRICLGGCSKHEGIDQEEDLLDRDKSADKGTDSTDEMSHVLGSLGAANILSSRGLRSIFTTASISVATASTDIFPAVAAVSGSFPTAVIFTTASVATPTTRVTRSSRGVVIGSSSLIFVNIPSINKKDKGKGN